MIGLFGVGEVLSQIAEKHGKLQAPPAALGRIWPNRREWKQIAPATLTATGIGVIVGAIPAAGGDIASVIAWEQARKLSRRPEEFGQGSLEGLAATCASCNAVVGGAMTTMLTLGIPGDGPTAILIGALLIHGIQPGPMLFRTHGPLVWSIVFLMALAAVLMMVLGLAASRPLARVLRIPDPWLWTGVLLFGVVGSYALNNAVSDVWIMLSAGVFGFLARRAAIPLGPLILGLILGPLMESNLRRALILSRGDWLDVLARPLVLLFVCGAAASLLWPLLRRRSARLQP
jgi:putative tricarboxylic transport membrane protein